MCNPGGVNPPGGCSSASPAPAIITNALAGVIGTNNNVSAYIAQVVIDGAPCTTCAGSLTWDNATAL